MYFFSEIDGRFLQRQRRGHQLPGLVAGNKGNLPGQTQGWSEELVRGDHSYVYKYLWPPGIARLLHLNVV